VAVLGASSYNFAEANLEAQSIPDLDRPPHQKDCSGSLAGYRNCWFRITSRRAVTKADPLQVRPINETYAELPAITRRRYCQHGLQSPRIRGGRPRPSAAVVSERVDPGPFTASDVLLPWPKLNAAIAAVATSLEPAPVQGRHRRAVTEPVRRT